MQGILGNDSDFDSIPDHIDNEPFVFNPDQQQIMLPSIAHCSAEYSYNVTWSLTAAGNIDTKPCPGTHKGDSILVYNCLYMVVLCMCV